MKKFRLLFSAIAVFAVVTSAFAFKKQAANLLVCRNNVCQFHPTIPYSTTAGTPVTPPETIYKGTPGTICGGSQCPVYTLQVFTND